MSNPYLSFKNILKYYEVGNQKIYALDGMDFEVERGEFVVIVGPSGSGKTTLLNILGGMDLADQGDILLDDRYISRLTEKQLTKYRRDDVGFVFQFYNLMPNLTALENVEIAQEISNNPLDALKVLDLVGLSERMNNFPAQLSGGEQQRTSIARALAKNPKILLCDEPTGALDYETGKTILKLLHETCKKTKTTIILVTHNTALTAIADRVIHVRNGKVSKMIKQSDPLPVTKVEW